MKKKMVLICMSACFILSCSNRHFFNTIREKRHVSEILEFKEYLLKTNVMDDFKEYKIIEYAQADSVVRSFFVKYEVKRMYIDPCNQYKHPKENFRNCGDIIELYYNNKYFLGPNHSLIFDYSKGGLQLNEGVQGKHKIADRVFVF